MCPVSPSQPLQRQAQTKNKHKNKDPINTLLRTKKS